MKTLNQVRTEAKEIIDTLKAIVTDKTVGIEKRNEAYRDMMKHQKALLLSYK